MTPLTIAFANLQSGVAATKGWLQYASSGWKYWLPHSEAPLRAAGAMLRDEHADIACFVEVSERSLPTAYHSQLDVVAAAAGMAEKAFFFPPRWTIRPQEGKALLSRYPIRDQKTDRFAGGFLPRYMVEASISVGGRSVSVFIAHLPLNRPARKRQLTEIESVLKNRSDPMILAGDFNEPDPFMLQRLILGGPLAHICTQLTFPSWRPARSLDYIFLSKEFSVLECKVPGGPVFSDHLPLLVKVEF